MRFAQETIVQTLAALREQCHGLSAEVIAVASSADPTAALLRDLPDIRVLEAPGERSVPQLRAEGIRAARGRLVAITEDHCLFSPGWVAGLIEAHRQQPEAAAIGGPVENGRTAGLLDWAIYFSRYAGSMPPMPRGPVRALPGNNACYRREVLDRHQSLFAHGFWEHDFNRELVDRGHRLWLEPGLVVTHHKPYRFGPYLALRRRHARCFGGMLGARLSPAARMLRSVLAPLIPLSHLLRAAGAVWARKRRRAEFLLSLPALLLCYGVWFWGELEGYVLGPGPACSQTD